MPLDGIVSARGDSRIFWSAPSNNTVMNDLCTCVTQLVQLVSMPSVSSVLKSAHDATLCTAEQCFADGDIAFAITPLPTAATSSSMTPVVLATLAMLATYAVRRRK